MITHVYIDGYNLYYRAVRNTQFKWLDLRELAETLFQQTQSVRSVISLLKSVLVRTTPIGPSGN